MSDLFDRVLKDQDIIKKLIGKIPGFDGYIERANRRMTDKIVREQIANTFEELWQRLSGLQVDFINQGEIKYVDDLEAAAIKLRQFIDRIRTAAYGYSGFFDAEGEWAYRISRYRRLSDTLPWDFMNLWTAKITNTSAQRVEDNIRFVKLSFPINERKTWNGNAFNYYIEEDYSYADIHQPFSLGGFSFDSTVNVIQNDFTSNVNRILKNEIYANHVGMVYKRQDSLNTVHLPNGTVLILNGMEYQLHLSNYKH